MLCTTLLFSISSLIPAQIQEDFGTFNPDPGWHFQFGYDLAVDGDTLVVGAHQDDQLARLGGAVFVYERDGLEWVQQAKLVDPLTVEADRFGCAVDLQGDTLAIGAWSGDGLAESSGIVHIFERSTGVWNKTQLLMAPDGKKLDFFGWSLALDQDTLVIGAPRTEPLGMRESGAVYVFTHNGQDWQQQAKLTAADGATDDRFGEAVALHGDTILVGAPFDDDHGSASGSAYVFHRTGTTWTQQAKLTYFDGRPLDVFGYDVALTADRALVGAYRAKEGVIGRDAGAGFVFERTGDVWNQTAKLVSQSLQLDDDLGRKVAIDGDLAVLSARGFANDRGKFVYFRWHDGTWIEQGEGFSSVGQSGDYFGYGMDLDGDRLVVGAYRSDASGFEEAGAIGVYNLFRLDIFPDPPIAGNTITARVRAGVPEAWTYLAASTIGHGFFPVPPLDVVLSLDAPNGVGSPIRTDALGGASWTFTLPPTAAGTQYWVQALQMSHVTNLRTFVVQ
jgi:hypothetical protein